MNEALQAQVSGFMRLGEAPMRMVYRFENDPVSNREFELIVTTRSPAINTDIPLDDLPTPEDLETITARTMFNWTQVMYALIFGTQFDADKAESGIQQIKPETIDGRKVGIEASDGQPYCTVWNMTNYYNPMLSITVHSWDNGEHAYKTALAQVNGIQKFNDNAHRLKLIVIGDTTNSPKQLPQTANKAPKTAKIGNSDNPIGANTESPQKPQNEANTGENTQPTGKPYVRSTRSGLAPNLIAIEKGKGKTPNYNTQAIIGNTPYNYKELPYDDKQIAIYEIDGAIKIDSYTDNETNETSLYVDIPVTGGSAIRFYDRGGEHNYDWGGIARAIGYENSENMRNAIGNTHFIPAKYITIKIYHAKNGKKYAQYDGFYAGYEGDTVSSVPQVVPLDDDIPF